MASFSNPRSALGRMLRLRAASRPNPTITLATEQQLGPCRVLARGQSPQKQSFSSSATLSQRRSARDANKQRGVSSLYRSGPRYPLSVSGEPLPVPVKELPKIEVDADHGLWGFFYEPGKLMNTPDEDLAFGRAWTAEELRKKDWNDLHSLWWVCVKERNRISTANRERVRAKMGFGDYESSQRDAAVSKTMQQIRHVLTERFYAWEDAVKLARNDPEVDLSGKGPAYVQSPDEYFDTAEEEVQTLPGDSAKGEQSLEREPVR